MEVQFYIPNHLLRKWNVFVEYKGFHSIPQRSVIASTLLHFNLYYVLHSREVWALKAFQCLEPGFKILCYSENLQIDALLFQAIRIYVLLNDV